MVQSGVLCQLAAVTGINRYLDIMPQMTFFRKTWRRHSAFAIGEIQHEFNGYLKWGCKSSATITRSGDLLGRAWFQWQLGPIKYRGNDTGNPQEVFNYPHFFARFTNAIGHAGLEDVELNIGGSNIDCHSGIFMDIWDEVSNTDEHALGEIIGKYDSDIELAHAARKTQNILTPFVFFHNKFYENYLPIIGLQFHDVKYCVKLKPLDELTVYGGDLDQNGQTLANSQNVYFPKEVCNPCILTQFVYLERGERRFFAKTHMEWLIDQVQRMCTDKKYEDACKDVRLDFNHAVIELFIIARQSMFNVKGINDLLNYSGPVEPHTRQHVDPFTQIQLKLNNHERTNFCVPIIFMRHEMPRMYHTRIPHKHIYNYSFALYPECNYPSGSCNFSHIDNATLKFLFPTVDQDTNNLVKWEGNIDIFARNWNIFKVAAGMGAVRYCN